MSIQGNDYIVGKSGGRFRVFLVKKAKRLGVTVARYFMASHLPQSQWKEHKGIIVKKSEILKGRQAAREVCWMKNEGKLK